MHGLTLRKGGKNSLCLHVDKVGLKLHCHILVTGTGSLILISRNRLYSYSDSDYTYTHVIYLPECNIYLPEFNIYLPVFNILLPEFNIYLPVFADQVYQHCKYRAEFVVSSVDVVLTKSPGNTFHGYVTCAGISVPFQGINLQNISP